MRILWLVPLLGMVLVAGSAQAVEDSDLGTDKRLSAPITLSMTMVTIQDLLQEVAKTSTVDLQADEPLRLRTVLAHVKDQPSGKVLLGLAESQGYSWKTLRSKDAPNAYRLVETEGARLRAATAMREYRREAAGELDVQLRLFEQFARKYVDVEPRTVRDEIQQREAALSELPTGSARYQAERELRAAQHAVQPDSKPLWRAWYALPPALRERVLDGSRLIMATRRPGAVPMPEEVLASLRETRQFRAARASRGPDKPVARQTDDEAMDFLSEVRNGNLSLVVRGRWLPGETGRMSAVAPSFLLTPSMLAYGPKRFHLKPGKVTAERPELLRSPITFIWADKKLQKEDPLTYGTGITVGEVLARFAVGNPQWSCVGDANLEGMPSLRTGKETGPGAPNPFISTATRLQQLTERGKTGTLPLGELLNELAANGGVDIHVTKDGLIRHRSSLYFLTRDRQIPPAHLKEVFGPMAEGAPFTPETGMLAGKLLSQAQVDALDANYLGFPARMLRQNGVLLRQAIRGWALVGALSSPTRKLLFGGTPLRYSSLPRTDQAELRRYLQTISDTPDGAPLDLDLGPGDLPLLEMNLRETPNAQRLLEFRIGKSGPPMYWSPLGATWETK